MNAAASTAQLEPAPGTDAAAQLRKIFDAHHAFVWRSARRLGVTMSDVDDVVQETFIVAGRKLADFEGRASVKTWLFAITIRVAHTYGRSHRRRERRAAAVAETANEAIDPYPRADAADLLHRLLGELDQDRRAAFILADIEGQTAADIATDLGINVNTIYSRIRSARKQVEQALMRHEAQEGASQ